jgi:hypothetical protein
MGLALVERLLGGLVPASLRLARRLQPLGAVAAVVSLLLGEGTLAGVVACGWLAVCLCATVAGVVVAHQTWQRAPERRTLGDLTMAAGLCYLSVGGAWLVISRLELRPFDLSTDIVRLTAVHFHYAGFALPVLAAAGLAGVDWLASRVALVTGCMAAVAAPPVVAAGFVFDSAVGQVGGALAMTTAAWGVAFGTFLLATSATALTAAPAAASTGATAGAAAGPALFASASHPTPAPEPPLRPERRPRDVLNDTGRALLVVSSVAPLVPMVLAVQWALAQHVSMPALSINAMASTHGLLNAVGFVMFGLAGWLLVVPPHVAAPPGDDCGPS